MALVLKTLSEYFGSARVCLIGLDLLAPRELATNPQCTKRSYLDLALQQSYSNLTAIRVESMETMDRIGRNGAKYATP